MISLLWRAMNSENDPKSVLTNISIWCLFITACISVLAFTGWVAGSVFITSISPNYKPIPPSTILCLFVISVSFSFYIKKPENHVLRIIAITCAIVVMCICVLISVCFFAGIRIEPEHLFFVPQNFPIGHMAPATSTRLAAISLGILLLTFPSYKKKLYNNLAAFCAIISIVTGLFVLIGYLYETPVLYREDTIPVSIPGAVSMIFLGMGLLAAAGPNTIPVKFFISTSVRSRLTRAFLPVILAAVFINDILVRILTSFAKVNIAFARSLIAIASAAIVGIIIAKLTKSIGTQIDDIHNELVKKDEELVTSNDRFKMIAENINEAFWVLDAKIGNIIYISPGYEKIWGRSEADIYQTPLSFYDSVIAEDRDKLKSAILCHKAGEKKQVEYRILRPDGSMRWIEGQGYSVKDASGQVKYNISVIRDITERKQVEENLKSERDFSDTALNSLPVVFYLFDNTGRFLRWNKHVELVTGYCAEEIGKMHPLDFISDSDKALVAERIETAFKKGVADVEADYETKSGRRIPYYFTARPFHFKGLPCLIGIGIDITERRINALALKKEKETVQKYLDIAGVMIVIVDLDMKVLVINKKACEVIGYEEKEVMGKNAIDIFIPEDIRPEVKTYINKLIADNIDKIESTKFNDIVLTKNGQRRTIAWDLVFLKDDMGKVTGILSSGEDITERIAMQNMLMQAKNEWEETFDTINDAITIHDNKHNIIQANKTAKELLGRSFDDIRKLKCFQLYHGYNSPLPDCPCCNVLKTGEISVQRIFEPHLNRHLEIKAIPRFDKNNQPVGVVHIVRDISDQVKAGEEQRLLQSQFLHIQKMESIGRLAGGVAHDFNNLLSGILGFSELALLDIPEDDPLRERIELIIGLGEKAGSLTQQLLAFSRKQQLVMKGINLSNVVNDIAKMLKRIIGEDIKLELITPKTIRGVMADQGQMEQVLLNLAVNARDAMSNGGVLTIETSESVLREDNIQEFEDMYPGEYVKLAVSDTGCGMSSKVLENIFEPFFTTKEVGKGTGLGLATVYGIIKQHKGHIDVKTGLDEGSVFNIYLPVSTDKGINKVFEPDVKQIGGGTETILVVDDEPILLSIIEKALKPLGYRLLIAVSPQEAIKINESYDEAIDMLLTDIVMPKMNGKQLAGIIKAKHPGINVVFMSGYPEDDLRQQNDEKDNELYLRKPLRINKLRKIVREVLDNKNI